MVSEGLEEELEVLLVLLVQVIDVIMRPLPDHDLLVEVDHLSLEIFAVQGDAPTE